MKSLTSSILFTLNLVIITDWVHDLVGELRALLFASRSLACLASSEQVIDLLSQLFAKQVIEQLSELFAEQIVGLLGKYFARQATVSSLVACSASSEQAGLLTFLASSEQADLLFASRSLAFSVTSLPGRSFDLLEKSGSMTCLASSEQVISLLSEDLAEPLVCSRPAFSS
ncbi:hypothetical protein PCANC_06956 [Puccinia coronata f. sp. avenae]|uniref:Uncharacterized protein n=1 Tax=Puccinia coronata f. sp. avenae TaxID=200324 RepID=A0A2N5VKT2_9BASI|nr:hypothetical protein PCANC_06956 [Puccinia coronata f. sp. avenae]